MCANVTITVTTPTRDVTLTAPALEYTVTALDNGQLQIKIARLRTITFAAGAWHSCDVEAA